MVCGDYYAKLSVRTFGRLKKLCAILMLSFTVLSAKSQQNPPAVDLQGSDSLKKGQPDYRGRKILVGSLSAAIYAGSLIALDNAWYKNYPKTSFHTFNDAGEWLQVDKVVHGWTAYQTSRVTTAAWQWAGFRGEEKNKAVILGS